MKFINVQLLGIAFAVSWLPSNCLGDVADRDQTGAACPWTSFTNVAKEHFGDAGIEAAEFLAAHRPGRDDQLDLDLLLENLEYALRARDEFAWAAELDDAIFFNDVLPYAVLDEDRDRWRPDLYRLSREIVQGAESAEQAVQALNQTLFATLNLRYSTTRRRPNQNVTESMRLGVASCTGLSIVLVNACRSVGIPARVAGIASWPGRGGNHTWVEIWDGRQWRFTGAAEFDAGGMDRAWFTAPAAGAIQGHHLHAIWASSWRVTEHHFPLAWDMTSRSVPAVDVTHRYQSAGEGEPANDEQIGAQRAVRLWSSRGGTRLAAAVTLRRDGEVIEATTFADPHDINLVAQLPHDPDAWQQLALTVNGQMRLAWIGPTTEPARIVELYWDELSLPQAAAEQAASRLWQERASDIRKHRAGDLEANVIREGEHELRLLQRTFGDAPENGRSLWISMHGGGGAPADVNDRQWANQIRLYEPDEGIYIAPRAPSNTWNLWHRSEVDRLFDRLIETAIAVWDVNPDRVYLLGYSAGGDGVYQLAPRMADRFAAAAMMAGHPNDASPLGLRNLPFAIYMGAEDVAYNRNTVAAQWGERLAQLQAEDEEGYPHRVVIYPELGHWMNGLDAEALPWMASHERSAWPRRVVWQQGNVPHLRFYWLEVNEDDAIRGRTIVAEVTGQTITIESDETSRIAVLLHDDLVDLDRQVRVVVNGSVVFEGHVSRTTSAIEQSLKLRSDPRAVATARLVVSW